MGEKCILYVSSTNYKLVCAGTEKFMGGLIDTFRKEDVVHSIQFFPLVKVNDKLNKLGLNTFYLGVNYDGEFVGTYLIEDALAAIEYISKKYDLECDRVIINQLHRWNLISLSVFLSELKLPIILVVHDYMMVCPYMMLSDSKAIECGNVIEKPSKERCICCKYAEQEIEHFDEINGFFLAINELICKVVFPSCSAQNNWIKVFPYLMGRSTIRPHLKYINRTVTRQWKNKIRIGYLGYISDIKGYSEWLKLMNSLDKDRFEFYYFGAAIKQAEKDGAHAILVDFNCPGSPGMVEQLVVNKIDIAFLWSNCQETYSYTYYEAFEAGCWIVTSSHSGNITDEVRRNENGRTFDTIEECVLFLNDLQGEYAILKIENVKSNCSTTDFTPTQKDTGIRKHSKAKRPKQMMSLLYRYLRRSK